MGSAGAGAVKRVAICKLMSNKKADCGTDLNPSADLVLDYVYEFPIPNGNVVLKAGSTLYFFDGTKVEKLTKYRTLGATSDSDASGGIKLPSSPTYYATPNFVMALDSGELVVVTREGKVIKDSDSTGFSVNASCETVEKQSTSTTYKLNTDGTSTSTTIPTTLASAGGKYLVQNPDNDKIYLSNSKCSASGVVVGTITDPIHEAQMVKVIDSNNNPHFLIAIRTAASSDKIKYYRVSGDSATDITPSDGITLASANKYYYALDGKGRLYAITAADKVEVFNIDGTPAGTATVTGVTFTGLLGLADRALAKDGTDVHEITTNGSEANPTPKGSTLHEVVDKCTDDNTRAIDGAGTNFIRCAHNDGLYSLTFDSGTGLYSKATESISSISEVKWATGKVLVKSDSSIKLCSTTTTPSISCSNTDLPGLDLANDYLKFNGNNVFYLSGTSPKVGDIFGTQTTLPIAVGGATGGNASFDLTKFAFSFRPGGAACNTQIAYFSSPTASPEYYTIAQPSGACVERILKVY
jgi:hypothetical protein